MRGVALPRRLSCQLAATLLLACLAGCVQVPQGGEQNDIKPESEQSKAERSARVHLELAGLYLGRNQAQTALDEVKLALASKPDLPEAYNLRGLAYGALGDASAADASFQHALQLAPNDGATLHNYGWFLCQERHFAQAHARFDAALKLPQYRDRQRTLLAQGVCDARAGDWPAAEVALMHSYELDPSNPAIAFNLSEVLLHRGEFERARFYIKRVNDVPEQSNAQSLWLAARIEHRAGKNNAAQDFGRRLRERFPKSAEALKFERGQFDE
jgi:type IV pilus assembly protein PilF